MLHQELYDRIAELKEALQDAIDFIDNYADYEDDDESQPTPNRAAILMFHLEDVLKGEKL